MLGNKTDPKADTKMFEHGAGNANMIGRLDKPNWKPIEPTQSTKVILKRSKVEGIINNLEIPKKITLKPKKQTKCYVSGVVKSTRTYINHSKIVNGVRVVMPMKNPKTYHQEESKMMNIDAYSSQDAINQFRKTMEEEFQNENEQDYEIYNDELEGIEKM